MKLKEIMNRSLQLKAMVFICCFIVAAALIESCKDVSLPPQPTNEAEVITTVKIELKDTLTGQYLNYFFRDLDAEGGNAPSQWDTIRLADSSFYNATLKFLNESNPNAVVDITQEIFTEKANHIICLIPDLANVAIKRTDTDGTYEIGIFSTWKTGGVSNGDITITLKHQPGVKNGGCTPGETDVEVKCPAIIH